MATSSRSMHIPTMLTILICSTLLLVASIVALQAFFYQYRSYLTYKQLGEKTQYHYIEELLAQQKSNLQGIETAAQIELDYALQFQNKK